MSGLSGYSMVQCGGLLAVCFACSLSVYACMYYGHVARYACVCVNICLCVSHRSHVNEMCNMMLAYWPNIEAFNGCAADQYNNNLCFHEAKALIQVGTHVRLLMHQDTSSQHTHACTCTSMRALHGVYAVVYVCKLAWLMLAWLCTHALCLCSSVSVWPQKVDSFSDEFPIQPILDPFTKGTVSVT